MTEKTGKINRRKTDRNWPRKPEEKPVRNENFNMFRSTDLPIK